MFKRIVLQNGYVQDLKSQHRAGGILKKLNETMFRVQMGREACFEFGNLGESSIDTVHKLLSRLVFFDLAYLMEFGRGERRVNWRNREEIFFIVALLSQLNFAVAKQISPN